MTTTTTLPEKPMGETEEAEKARLIQQLDEQFNIASGEQPPAPDPFVTSEFAPAAEPPEEEISTPEEKSLSVEADAISGSSEGTDPFAKQNIVDQLNDPATPDAEKLLIYNTLDTQTKAKFRRKFPNLITPKDTPGDEQKEKEALIAQLDDSLTDEITPRKALLLLNKGISNLLDLPVEATAGIMNQINSVFGGSDNYFQGNPVRQLFELLGQTLPEEDLPKGPVAEAFTWAGEGIATLPFAPLFAALKTAHGATGVRAALKKFLKDVGETAVRSPTKFAATEVASSFGAGLTFGIAKEETDDPTIQFLAGMVGGITPSVAVSILKFGGLKSFKLLNDARLSFTESQADPRAAARIERASSQSAEDLISNFDDKSILPSFRKLLTPAQSANDAGLLELEKSILNSDDVSATLRQDGNVQIAELNEVIIKSATADDGVRGQFNATFEEIQTQTAFIETLWKNRLDIAKARMQKRIREVGPKINKNETSIIVRQELEAALADATETQKQLWAKVDDTVKISTEPLMAKWEEILRNFARLSDKGDLKFSSSSQTDDLLKELGSLDAQGKFIAGRMGKTESIKELQALRSRLLEDIRRKPAQEPSSNKKRIFSELQGTIRGMFDAMEENIIFMHPDGSFTPPEQRLLKALAFSRRLNEDFNIGTIGKLLGRTSDGGFSIEPELTLSTILGSGVSPEKANVNLKALMKAVAREAKDVDKAKRIGVDDDPKNLRPVTEAVKAYIKHRFIRDFVVEGRIKKSQALKWLEDNRETFKHLEGLKDEFRAAIEVEDFFRLLEDQADVALKGVLDSKERAAAVRFLEQEPVKIFDNLVNTSNDKVTTRQMIDLVKKAAVDKTGEATKGLQQAVFDWIITRSTLTSESGADALGSGFVSGFKMTRFLRKPEVKAIIDTVLTDAQRARLELLENSAQRLDQIRGAKPAPEGIIKDAPGWILEFIGSIAGAQIGRKVAGRLGGGTVQTPGAFASRARILLKSLTKDHAKIALIEALTAKNPDRLKALLMMAKTPAEVQFQNTQLNAWMGELIARYNIDIEEDPIINIQIPPEELE